MVVVVVGERGESGGLMMIDEMRERCDGVRQGKDDVVMEEDRSDR